MDRRAVDVISSANTPVMPSGAAATSGNEGQPNQPGAVPRDTLQPATLQPDTSDEGEGLTATLQTFDFGEREVGTTSTALEWPVTNSGGALSGQLALYNSNPAEFAVINRCPAALGQDQSCTLGVSFAPSDGGPRAGRLELSNGSRVVALDVTGSGLYRLTVQLAGTGRVSSTVPGIDCGSRCSGLFAPGPVVLNAQTSNGDNSFFTGWSSSSCPGPRRECTVQLDSTQSLSANFATQEHNLIFVSSTPYPANLGSVAAYDVQCNALASAAGINDASRSAFVASLADSAGAADPTGLMLTRLGAARGWVRMDGIPFGDRPADLFTFPANVHSEVAFMETGQSAFVSVWSGFTPIEGLSNCTNWTDVSDTVANVLLGATNGGPFWSDSSVGFCSGSNTHIYCLGKTKTQPLGPLPIAQGKRIWVTNTNYLPGTMSPDQKCQSELPAEVARGVALIGYTDRPAAALLDPDAMYVRPDGLVVGRGLQLVNMDLVTSPWVLADGGIFPSQPIMWTGGVLPLTGLPTADQNCNDWQNADGTGSGGLYGYAGENAWAGYGGASCSSPARIYCVEP